MLGDVLLDAKKPEQALAECELDLKFNPNRFNGLYGAGRGAELLGQHEKARQYYGQLLTNCAGSHSLRPELAHATGAIAGK